MAIIEQGQLKGAFKGFHNMETVFEFFSGREGSLREGSLRGQDS